MKAISLKQPWANMIAHGKKTIETRKWKTAHRGLILICSSMNVDGDLVHDWPVEPLGHALAVAEIVDCRPMTPDDASPACIGVYPRANAWFLTNVRRIKPFPVKGALGVFDVDVDPQMLSFLT